MPQPRARRHVVETHSVLGALYLTGVGRTDGGQQIGIQEARLQEIDAPIREIVLVQLVLVIAETEVGDDIGYRRYPW